MSNDSVKPKVLLLTQESSQVIPIVSLLEAAGFVVVKAATENVRGISHRHKPDVIIANIHDSGDLEQILRPFDEIESAPVILTGDAAVTRELQSEAIAKGAFDYVQVSENLSLLFARIRQLMSIKQTRDRLDRQASSDSLSGLSNRRRFRLALGRELERWRRYQVPCGLLSLDIDHMKKINDAHGHPGGDAAITHVGRALASVAREVDTASRLGGEEFALLLAGVNEKQVLRIAEHLRETISSPVPGIGVITVSIGAACCPTHAQSEKELYYASDIALYRAKEEGRNRTVMATLPSP